MKINKHIDAMEYTDEQWEKFNPVSDFMKHIKIIRNITKEAIELC